VKEIHRVAKLGLRGMELSCSWDMEPMWHPVWEPLWKAVHEVNLPLHFHTFPSLPPGVRERQTGLTRRAAQFTSVAGFQMNLVNILAAVIGAAVLDTLIVQLDCAPTKSSCTLVLRRTALELRCPE